MMIEFGLPAIPLEYFEFWAEPLTFKGCQYGAVICAKNLATGAIARHKAVWREYMTHKESNGALLKATLVDLVVETLPPWRLSTED